MPMQNPPRLLENGSIGRGSEDEQSIHPHDPRPTKASYSQSRSRRPSHTHTGHASPVIPHAPLNPEKSLPPGPAPPKGSCIELQPIARDVKVQIGDVDVEGCGQCLTMSGREAATERRAISDYAARQTNARPPFCNGAGVLGRCGRFPHV